MSHPYWPQPLYHFRPRHAGPVPAGPQLAGFAGYSYGAALAGGGRRYGSLSPKYDWATPGYVRAEPSGLGCVGCVGFGQPEEISGCPDIANKIRAVLIATISKITEPLRSKLTGVPWSTELKYIEKFADVIIAKVGLTDADLTYLANLAVSQGRAGLLPVLQLKLQGVFDRMDLPVLGEQDITPYIGDAYDYLAGKLAEICGGSGAPGYTVQPFTSGGVIAVPAGGLTVILSDGTKFTLPPGATPVGDCIKPECPGQALFYYKTAEGALRSVFAGGRDLGVIDPASVAALNAAASKGLLRQPKVLFREGVTAPTGAAGGAGGVGVALALAAGAVVLFKLLGK